MNVGFYNFTKRENSTLQPGVGVVRDDFACKLKDNCSIISPVIELVVPTGYTITSLINYNYCYIQDFSRFYFVADKVFLTNNIIEYHLECDVLASFRQQIGSASEYVLRSASTYDTDVLDDLYPMNAVVSFDEGTVTAPGVTPVSYQWNPFNGMTGMIVVGIINSATQIKNGAVTYYKISYTTLCNMMQYLLSSAGYFNLNPTEISDNLAKALVNPIQYITEAFYVPYDWGTPYVEEHLKMGWWDLPTDGNYKGTPLAGIPNINDIGGAIATQKFYIPMHPQAGTRGRYMRCAPWSRYMLHAGPFGNIPIDPANITNSDYITCEVYGNMFGDVYLKIKNQYGHVISTHRASVKHTYCIGQINNDPSAFLGGLLNTAGSFMNIASNPGGAIAGTASGIISNQHNLYPQCQTSGTNASGAENGIYWTLVGEFHNAVNDDNTHRGRPLCQVKTISTLSGYILVADADIAVPGTAEENEKIKAYMNGGFYYE